MIFFFLQGLGSEIYPLNFKLCVSATIAQYGKLIGPPCAIVKKLLLYCQILVTSQVLAVDVHCVTFQKHHLYSLHTKEFRHNSLVNQLCQV